MLQLSPYAVIQRFCFPTNFNMKIVIDGVSHTSSNNYTQYTTKYNQADHEYFYFTNSLNDIKYSFPKHRMSHLIHMLSNLKIVREHIQIIDQRIVSHILTYNPVSGYQHLTLSSEGSTFILTYNLVNRLTHISNQFKKKNTYFESHITKAQFIQNIIIYLVLRIIPNTEAYRRSQYQIET